MNEKGIEIKGHVIRDGTEWRINLEGAAWFIDSIMDEIEECGVSPMIYIGVNDEVYGISYRGSIHYHPVIFARARFENITEKMEKD